MLLSFDISFSHQSQLFAVLQMEEQLRNPKKKEKKKDPKINDYQSNDDRRGMTRPVRPVPEFHKRKGKQLAMMKLCALRREDGNGP